MTYVYDVDKDDLRNIDSSIEQKVPLNSQITTEKHDSHYEENAKLLSNNGRLSVFQKICFAIGGLPYQMCGNALGLFISPFLLEIAGLQPAELSIVLFSGRAWDAITDPLIGYFVNRTNTRFGKLRPWILFSAPFACACYMMIWFTPDIENRSLKTAWYLGFYCLFQTFLSCLHVPYTSLTMYLTHSQTERDSATSYRMGFEVFGVLLAAGIQGLMITLYNTQPVEDICNKTNETNRTTNLTTTNSIISIDEKFRNFRAESNLDEGYLLSAGVMSAIYLLCSLITFFGTKEVTDVITDKNTKFFRSLRTVFKHKSYVTLLITFLLSSLAIQLIQTNIALYCKYSVNAGQHYQYIIILLLSVTVLSLPLWQIFMIRAGKKVTYAVGLGILLPILLALAFIQDTIWLLYLLGALCGLPIAVSFLVPWSMIPDVIDEFMINKGERKESVFYSFFVFFTKMASGVAAGASALALEVAGYKSDKCYVQPESVGFALRMVVVPVPAVMILGCMFMLWVHPIDEKKRAVIKEKLIEIRQTDNNNNANIKI